MASIPGHPMIKKAIDVVIEHIRNRFYGNNPLEPTGPGAFGKAFNIHFGRKEDEPISVGMFDDDTKVIIHIGSKSRTIIHNIDGSDLIKTKFDNYYETMYSDKNSEYYGDLWNQRKIYKI